MNKGPTIPEGFRGEAITLRPLPDSPPTPPPRWDIQPLALQGLRKFESGKDGVPHLRVFVKV